MPTRMLGWSVQLGGKVNDSAYWGLTLEEGIENRLGAFRPDFPVTASQQVSLVR